MASGAGHAGRAYIGSFTAAGGRGVVSAAVDADTGALTPLAAADAVPDPSYLAFGPTRSVLYAVSETADGAVAAFELTGEAPKTIGAPVPVGGAAPTHLSVVGNHVLTANYGSGSVSAVPLAADGALAGAASAVLRHEGSGPHPQRQQGPHAHQVVPDPSGRWIVSTDLGTDSVRVCALGADGTLAVHRETALRPGSGPRHLAFHPRGDRAYVLNELSPTVTLCRWDAARGLLQPVGEIPVLPSAAEGDAFPSEIVVSPDGRFVWTATRGEDVISVLETGGDPDRLTLKGTVPCGGHWPRDLALDPAGRHLYAANERSGDVTWFAVEADGLPRRVGSVQAPAASCVVFG